MFKGMFPALVTPFEKGELDIEAYRALITFVLDNGADGVVPNGTTGENPALNQRERQLIISTAVEMCRERSAKVIAGAGTNNTYKTIELLKDAQRRGADAGLVITPYYNKPTQEGLLLHFRAAAQGCALPIVMYNVPSRTGVNMNADTAAELSKVENIVGLKEASGNLMQFADITASVPDDFTVLSGEDGLTLPMMALGCKGVISVAGNVAPRLMKDMLTSWNAGKTGEALKIHHRLTPLFKTLFLETSPAPCKKALAMMGMCSEEVRLPLSGVRNTTAEALRGAMEAIGIDLKE